MGLLGVFCNVLALQLPVPGTMFAISQILMQVLWYMCSSVPDFMLIWALNLMHFSCIRLKGAADGAVDGSAVARHRGGGWGQHLHQQGGRRGAAHLVGMAGGGMFNGGVNLQQERARLVPCLPKHAVCPSTADVLLYLSTTPIRYISHMIQLWCWGYSPEPQGQICFYCMSVLFSIHSVLLSDAAPVMGMFSLFLTSWYYIDVGNVL